jgi:hypothetical protein
MKGFWKERRHWKRSRGFHLLSFETLETSGYLFLPAL